MSWTTASEENNDYFQIERSQNGAKFEVLGKVKGAGTTVEPQTYNFVDVTPKAGVNYYRLKQVDFDGAFEYSNIVAAAVKLAGNLVAYPSPTSDVLVLESAASIEQIEIRDMAGRIVNRQTIGKEQTRVELNVAALTSGSYLVYVRSGATSQVVRFVKE
ncbi:MAG: T9SS type A sorting domain-containing protein [Saprospiraceae bacterium]|nr:T9SS type A sorting domain-containing protein [Saprospiraceae bacterium]